MKPSAAPQAVRDCRDEPAVSDESHRPQRSRGVRSGPGHAVLRVTVIAPFPVTPNLFKKYPDVGRMVEMGTQAGRVHDGMPVCEAVPTLYG